MPNIFDFIQKNIESCGYDQNVELKQRVALCLLEQVEHRLDKNQMLAFNLAQRQSEEEIDEKERIGLLEELIKKECDNNSSEFAINRLAISSLSKNDGLSGYMAEYLASWGERAGISDDNIIRCFDALIHEID